MVTVATEDAALQSKQLYVDDTSLGNVVVNNPERPTAVDTSLFANGTRTLVAKATDYAGNTMLSQRIPITVYNPISEIRISQSELFRDEVDPGQFVISGVMNDPGTWNLRIENTSGNTVFTDSGGQGVFQSTWDGKVAGNYVDDLYRIIMEDGSNTYDWIIAISLGSTAEMLISGGYILETPWDKEAMFTEMTAVADACRAQYVPFTVILNPGWEDGWRIPFDNPIKGMRYWLPRSYRYWFYAGHGSFIKDKTYNVRRPAVAFAEKDVYGDNYWVPSEQRFNYPAFSDLDLYPGKYRVVMLNTCNSAGSAVIWPGNDYSIAHAFGIYENEIEVDRVFVGWNRGYNPTFPMFGTLWTQDFWWYLGQGYSVGQARDGANGLGYPMGTFNRTIGGPYVTWFLP